MEKRNILNFKNWLDNIRILEDENGNFLAVILEDDNIYFLLDTMDPSELIIKELFKFSENNLLKIKDGSSKNFIGITEGMVKMENFAIENNYRKQQFKDTFISIELDKKFDVNIPNKYKLKSGKEVPDNKKGLGHVMAFGYKNTPESELSIKHYGNIKNAPGYNPNLDLFIVNEFDDVISFCNIWVDKINKIAVLEPVGTHEDYRFQGLGRAVIYEGLNRVKNMEIEKVFVGSTQEFYEKIGFKKEICINLWQKQYKI
jgi:GNAT superfamily N-acetyltransferase